MSAASGKPTDSGARLRHRLSWLCACLLVAAFMGQGVAFIGANSQTFDEVAHLAAGYSYLATGDFRLNEEHPPLAKELAALPVLLAFRLPFSPDPDLWARAEQWRIGQEFLYHSPVPTDRILTLARLPGLLLGAALVGLIGWWGYRLWGRAAGLLGMALATLEPNLVAHSCLVTTDVGVTLFTFLALYLLWEYTAAPSPWLMAAVGLCLGLALATKFSAVFLVGLAVVIFAGHALLAGVPPWPWRRDLAPGARPVAVVVSTVVVLALAGLTVVALYGGGEVVSWWDGFSTVLVHQGRGHEAFFVGAYSREGWWYYFPVAFLIKTPLGSLALIGLSLTLCRSGRPLRWRDATFLLAPVGLLFLVMVPARINIGLRHVLPVYPFLFVLAGRVATARLRWAWASVALWGVPLALTAASSLRVAPHELAYFNELVGGPGEGHRYLSDSNLDWGQDLRGLKAYMDREGLPAVYLSYFGTAPPEEYGVRYQYTPTARDPGSPPAPDDPLPPGTGKEVLAISVVNLQGVYLDDKGLYGWLCSRQPVAKIGYSIYAYDITNDADAHLHLARVYRKEGCPSLAALELRKALALDPARTEAAALARLFAGTPTSRPP
jgi:Dolichyl-phosphate-mannose-protein mannosyltransferase